MLVRESPVTSTVMCGGATPEADGVVVEDGERGVFSAGVVAPLGACC